MGVRRSRRLRRVTAVFVGLAVAVVTGGLYVDARSAAILARQHSVDPAALELAVDPAWARDPGRLARGRHVATAIAQCHFCHGTDLGGREIADDPWIGRLHATNLTTGRGGIAGRYSRADWVRAIRFGIGRDGRSLLLMPSAELAAISDQDLDALIAYLERVPGVDRERPPTRVGWLARVAIATGNAPGLLSAAQPRPPSAADPWPAPTIDASADYGAYLVSLGGCRVCHHADLKGGLHPLALPDEPEPPDISPTGPVAHWTREELAAALREGRTPEGRRLDRDFMPWPAYAALDDTEIEAIWRYLRSAAP